LFFQIFNIFLKDFCMKFLFSEAIVSQSKEMSRMVRTVLALFLTALVLTSTAHAQSTSLDASFAQTGTGLNSEVGALALQADGKVLVGAVSRTTTARLRWRALPLTSFQHR
jgi:hypothetical protein